MALFLCSKTVESSLVKTGGHLYKVILPLAESVLYVKTLPMYVKCKLRLFSRSLRVLLINEKEYNFVGTRKIDKKMENKTGE